MLDAQLASCIALCEHPAVRFIPILLAALSVAHGQDLQVLTFNVRYDRPDPGKQSWKERRDAVAAIIRANADVAGLQEVLPQQRKDLAERLPEFELVGIGRDPGDRGEASPLLVRKDRLEVLEHGTFWFSDSPEVVGSMSWGNEIPRICTWAKLRDRQRNAVSWFFNVHLDHRSQSSREKSVALLLDRIKERTGPVAVMGDFNAAPGNAAIAALSAASSLRDVYGIAGVTPGGTFHDFTGKASGGPIDWIFVDPGKWEVKNVEILTGPMVDGGSDWPSDHFPVKAVIRQR